MPQRPFSPEGVQEKMTDLFQLSNSALLAQASLAQSDFRQWVKDNFTLDSAQTTYLDNIDDRFIEQAASGTSQALTNRLNIILIRPVIPQPASKLIEMKNDIHPVQGPTGYGVSGSLSFTIRNA